MVSQVEADCHHGGSLCKLQCCLLCAFVLQVSLFTALPCALRFTMPLIDIHTRQVRTASVALLGCVLVLVSSIVAIDNQLYKATENGSNGIDPDVSAHKSKSLYRMTLLVSTFPYLSSGYHQWPCGRQTAHPVDCLSQDSLSDGGWRHWLGQT